MIKINRLEKTERNKQTVMLAKNFLIETEPARYRS